MNLWQAPPPPPPSFPLPLALMTLQDHVISASFPWDWEERIHENRISQPLKMIRCCQVGSGPKDTFNSSLCVFRAAFSLKSCFPSRNVLHQLSLATPFPLVLWTISLAGHLLPPKKVNGNIEWILDFFAVKTLVSLSELASTQKHTRYI